MINQVWSTSRYSNGGERAVLPRAIKGVEKEKPRSGRGRYVLEGIRTIGSEPSQIEGK